MKVHLRHVLAAAFSIIAIVPVLLLGAWVEGSAMRNEIASVSEKHLLLARNVSVALEGYVHDARAAFNFFVDAEIANDLNENVIALSRDLGFRHFYIIEDGRRISRHMMIKGEINAHHPAANIEMLQPYIAEGRTLFSHVMRDDVGRPVIFVVRKVSGKRIAIGELGTDIIIKYQKAISFGSGGHAAVVDRLGNIIAHPNKTWREQIKNISKVEPVARMMQGKTGVVGFYSPSVEKDMIAGFATVAGVGWGVMVPQPMEELEARVSGVKRAALIVIFIGLTVSAVIGWLVSGLIVRPVEAVAKAALAFAQGQDDVRVETPPLAPSEVRQLTDAFNQMARDAAVNLTAQERQRSEQRVRGAIASLQEGFALYDADDRLVLYNEAYEKLNPHAAFVMEQGHLFEDVVRARVETGLVVAAKGREEEFIQERLEYHKNPEGTILREFSDGRWIILRESRTPDGGVALTFVDVTELKRTEQALREREDQYRGLVEGSIQGILVEQNGTPVFANQAFADIFGYENPDEVLALDNLAPLYAPSDRDRVIQYGLDRARDRSVPNHYEFEGQRKDGAYIDVETLVHVVTWKGEPAIQSAAIDVTERTKAEKSLLLRSKSIALLQKIAVAANEATDADEALQVCIDEICSYTGWPVGHAYLLADDDSGELMPTKLWHLDDEKIYNSFKEITEQTRFASGVGLPGRVLATRKPAWIDDIKNDTNFLRARMAENLGVHAAFAFPISVADKTMGVLEFFSDSPATVNQVLLDEMTYLGAQIGRVIERERAAQALRESEQKNREFASDAAHELRTPLAVFRASLDGLDVGEKTEELRNEVDRMARMVEQLLALARLDTVAVTSDDEADMHAICVDVAAYLAPMAIRESRSIEVVGTESPVIVRGNSAALEMAVRNLVENAIKYSSRGTTITIDVSRDGSIRVLDIGHGIPTEFRRKAFERFTRLDRRGSGLGLGLAIVFRVIEVHGGTVDADANPAGGAQFTIRVPLADEVSNSEVKIPAE